MVPVEPQGFPGASKEDRVLDELAADGGAQVGFQALRRRLGYHPQVLSRMLRSLVRSERVQRSKDGYSLNPGHALQGAGQPARPFIPVLLALMPTHLDQSVVAERLARRWFKGLRWHSRSDHGEELHLTWDILERGRRVRLRLLAGVMALEAESDGPMVDVSALRPLVEALGGFYQGDAYVSKLRGVPPSLAA